MENPKTLEERIRLLEDREAIKELTSRYFWHAVRGETAAMASLFTADGVFDATPAGGPWVAQGFVNLVKYFDLVMKPVPTAIPTVHNHIMTIEGDEASGTCVLDTPIGGKFGGGFVGYYKDRYRRENGHWRFVERLFDNYAVFQKGPEAEIKPVQN